MRPGGKALDAQDVKPGVNLLMAPFGLGATSVALQDADGKVLLSGDGAEIVESTEIWDANYRAFAVPSDVMPSDFLDLGGSSSGSGSGSSKASSTIDVATTSGAATKVASTSAQATSRCAGSSTSSTSDDDGESSTTAAASSSSTTSCNSFD
ncbi:hypothetical protein JCM9279_000873 [Rhodotorula babjevae]